MAIIVYIVELDGRPTMNEISSQEKFDLMGDNGVYTHLLTFWNKIKKETGMGISDVDDACFQHLELTNLNELLQNEIRDSMEIPFDEWTFYDMRQAFGVIDKEIKMDVQTRFKIMFEISDYINKRFKTNYQYDIATTSMGNLRMEATVNLITIKKSDLLEYLNKFKGIVEKAIFYNKRLYLSYS